MTPKELREAVARAICAASDCEPWDDATALLKRCLLAEADAALAVVREAMREPSDQMVDAGEACDQPAATYSGYAIEYATCERHWAAMYGASPLAEDASDA